MNKLSTILMTTLIVAGCSSIPSFYDPNESKAIIDISTRVEMMDCDLKPASLKKQIRSIDFYVEWLNQYSLAKGSQDVTKITGIMDKTLQGLVDADPLTPTYCRIKKKNLQTQSKMAAEAIMGRY
jgi:uncharacterized protein YceK